MFQYFFLIKNVLIVKIAYFCRFSSFIFDVSALFAIVFLGGIKGGIIEN